MLRVSLSLFNNGAAITSIAALVCSSMFMALTGGALKSYEIQALRAGIAGMLGDEAAAQTWEAERRETQWATPLVQIVPSAPIELPQPPVDADLALLGPDLLGGPDEAMSPRVVAVTARTRRSLSRTEQPALEEAGASPPDKCGELCAASASLTIAETVPKPIAAVTSLN